MSDLAIQAVDLGKEYRIGKIETASYQTIQEKIIDTVLAPVRRVGGLLRGNAYSAAGLDEHLWALRHVNFEIKQGEVVGIVGHNGAGKSTLLKVLTEITYPSEGYVDIAGRVGSLLEVGTGFHPELTGKENVFLNGAILGMSRHEIERKYDEIVEFAEVAQHMNTPVKHYSSGMRLRLGFAVAAHLEPEILLIDEVLAVGDVQFQKKCIEKMSLVAEEGRTILFVSHNMSAINQLCPRCILLNHGQLVLDGPTDEVVAEYLRSGSVGDETVYEQALTADQEAQFLRVAIETPEGTPIIGDHEYDSPFEVVVDIHAQNELVNGFLTTSLRDVYGTLFLMSDSRDTGKPGIPAGFSRYRVRFPGGMFAPGAIYFTFTLTTQGDGRKDLLRNALQLRIIDLSSNHRSESRLGYFALKLDWEREPTQAVAVSS